MGISGAQLFEELWGFYRQKLSSEKMSSLDFAELVTYLLFLKMDDERSQRRINRVQVIPEGLGWQSLAHKSGSALEQQYRHVVQECGKFDPQPRTVTRQAVFRAAHSELRCDPALLGSFIKDVIIHTSWSDQARADLRIMYALLMEKASERFQIESGQTLTPPPLVSAVMDCLRPASSDVVVDPACGTGSLLVAAYESMAREEVRMDVGAITGADFDPSMCRFATMNYLLSTGEPFDSPPPVKVANSLAQAEARMPSVIVCNPPFRSTAPLPTGRTDLWVRSGSMQLNFLQHIARSLPHGGRAAVFVPDNILFGGGAELTVRRRLLHEYDVHTLLRLPTGVFARGTVKTNVIFFDAVRPRGDGTPATEKVWIYDYRSGVHFAARDNPLRRADLDDFVECYAYGRPMTERAITARFKSVSYQELNGRDLDLNIFCREERLRGVPSNPKRVSLEIIDELNAALQEFTALAEEFPVTWTGEEP